MNNREKFYTKPYFQNSVLPCLRQLAKREGHAVQASFGEYNWKMQPAHDQPTRNAFVIVHVDGVVEHGPKWEELT